MHALERSQMQIVILNQVQDTTCITWIFHQKIYISIYLSFYMHIHVLYLCIREFFPHSSKPQRSSGILWQIAYINVSYRYLAFKDTNFSFTFVLATNNLFTVKVHVIIQKALLIILFINVALCCMAYVYLCFSNRFGQTLCSSHTHISKWIRKGLAIAVNHNRKKTQSA